MICKYDKCGREFFPDNDRQQYCSKKCKEAAREQRRAPRKKKKQEKPLCTRCKKPMSPNRKWIGLCHDCTIIHRDLEKWKSEMRGGAL